MSADKNISENQSCELPTAKGLRKSMVNFKAKSALLLLAILICALGFIKFRLSAYVDDAYSYIIEAVLPYIENGNDFNLRDDFYLNGSIEAGDRKAVVHNSLYKDSEYWFWVGFNLDQVKKNKINIEVLNSKKEPINIKSKQLGKYGNVVGARFIAPSTGLYYIVFWAEDGLYDGEAEWALTYGQK